MQEGAVRRLETLLAGAGADPDEIAQARGHGAAAMLALFVNRSLVPGRKRLDRDEVVDAVGADYERALSFWRAMGMVEVPPGERAFSEVDAEMLGRALGVVESGVVDVDMALQMTRVMGRGLAQIAEAQLDVVRASIPPGAPEDQTMEQVMQAMGNAAAGLLTELEAFLVYMWRRHLAAVAERTILAGATGAGQTTVVGFADLVGFTAASQWMDDAQLASAVGAFERTAQDIISSSGGRVVKMIGDEVMFADEDPADAAEIALGLVEAFSRETDLPDVRVGLASGQVMPHQGDLFGRTVNLASRLVNLAYPGTVLVSEDVASALPDDGAVRAKPVRAQRLKGFGRTPVWVLRRP